jgi:hypothetical protein
LTINAPFGVRNLYFLSLDQKDGTPKILTSYGGSVADYAGSITSDETGNYYLTGFTNSASLFGQSASVTQKEETFVASIDSAGQLNWAKIVMTENPGYSPSDPLKLVLGPDKFPVMAGLFQSKTIALDGLHIANHDTSAISRDIFVVRFNPETKLATYLNSFGNMTFDFDLNLYSDIHNMVTTIAEVNDSIFYIGKDTLHFTPYTYGILIAHFDTSGVLLGQKAFMPITGQSFSVITNNVVQSYSGYLGVAGGFSGKTLYLGTKTLTAFNDTLSQNMFIAKMGYSMSGNIFDKSGLTKVTSGYVKLFVLAQSGPAAMADSSLIGETGGYKFTDAPLTGSLVYAVADTNIYPDYVGTYAGNSILWTGAAVLDLVSTPAPTFDITLKQVLPVTGPGEITGTVTETLYDTTSKSLKSTGRPMKGASVVLVGKSNKGSDVILAMTKTDNNGNYQFTNIPVGDYKVWIDVTGLGMIEYYAVGITDLAPTVENLNYIVAETGIYKDLSLAVRTIRKANDLLFVYPNPASDYIHAIISLNENNSAMIDIYSISGSHVKSIIIQSTTLGNAILNISDLPSGMYILKASVTGKITQYARFIKQ